MALTNGAFLFKRKSKSLNNDPLHFLTVVFFEFQQIDSRRYILFFDHLSRSICIIYSHHTAFNSRQSKRVSSFEEFIRSDSGNSRMGELYMIIAELEMKNSNNGQIPLQSLMETDTLWKSSLKKHQNPPNPHFWN